MDGLPTGNGRGKDQFSFLVTDWDGSGSDAKDGVEPEAAIELVG